MKGTHSCKECMNIRTTTRTYLTWRIWTVASLDIISCHAGRITLVMLVADNVQKLRLSAKSLDLNSIDHMSDLLKHTKFYRAPACYLSDVCVHSTTVYA